MRHLSVDIETRSSVVIQKSGSYKYALSEDFEILLFAYQADSNPVVVVDLKCGEVIPDDIKAALADPTVTKHAYNAAFEWWCLKQAGYDSPLLSWQCTMVHGMYCGYPGGLAAIGGVIGLPQEKQKLAAGKALIKYFCTPCAPTKRNGGRRWNDPCHDPDKWKLFKEYNRQDVVTERAILDRLKSFPVPHYEWDRWRDDVRMNATGINTDLELIAGALAINDRSAAELMGESKEATGLDNPGSNKQLLEWLQQKGINVDNLQKATIAELLEGDIGEEIRRVLEIRQQTGKTSISKYTAMDVARWNGDGRVRGLLQFYGANRTGRWAGRLVQVQNLPRNYIKTLDCARQLVKKQNYAGLKALYGNVPDTLSQLIRTAFIPSAGNKFIVSDFSAIEARVIAWLAGEHWVNEVFATHGKIYEATASQMFHVPIEKISKGNPEYELRQKGKVATLALGYQGGVNALIAMGALRMGLSEDELPDIVQRWRAANRRICDLWYAIDQASVTCVQTAEPQATHGIIFRLESDLIYGQVFLTAELPSGRKLFYPKPHLAENQFGRSAIHYYTVGQQSRKWERTSTYGGKLAENIVQAIARDCLAETLRRLSKNYQVVMHIHDEVVIDAPADAKLDDVNAVLSTPIPWAPGLILKGAGFESEYYMKD